MKENKMGTMEVRRLILTMSLPIMISMLVQALYNIVDSMFVARVSEAALAAVCMMGLSGEIAHSRLLPGEGSGTYRSRMLDAAFCMEGAGLEQGAKYELQ